MAKRCAITGKTSRKSASRSHSNVKTLRRQHANIQKRVVNGKVTWVSARGIKTLKKQMKKA